MVVNGNDKTTLAKANWSNYTIGADGIRIINIFPGMDAEMRVSRGRYKNELYHSCVQICAIPGIIF